jgi:predicted membrane-bound dolichyl-phosphate-mannose-protein mannosyltransferase
MWLKNLSVNKPTWLIPLIWVLAIGIRVYGVTTRAQYYDMGTFQAWGIHMLTVGPVHFYDQMWSDYLPLPLYLFAPIQLLSSWLHLSFGFVFKSLFSLLELGLIYWISRVWKGKGKVLLLALLALSPALIGDNAFWGQIDTAPALLTLLSFITLSPVLFGLAVAIKPIMILVAPVLWILAIKKGRWWQFPLFSGLTFFLSGVPMGAVTGSFQLLWSRTLNQAGTYPYTTINAWNMWSLIPHLDSWLPDNQTIFNLSAHTVGLLLFSFFTFSVFNHWRQAKFSPKYALKVGALILILFYTFTTRMHERHLLFGLPFLALAVVSDRWLILPFILYTLSFILNLYSAFYWVNHAQAWPFDPWVSVLCSWGITLLSLGLSIIWDWPKFLRSTIGYLRSNKLLVGVLIVATLLRFINLGHPPAYIFDEVYHAFTAREFMHNNNAAWEWWTTPPPGVAYEWTHPPFAKYGMVAGMLLFGENSFGWRVGSAVFGVISIYGLYLLVLALTKNKTTALLSAFLVSIEGLHISQSRIAMNDIYMLALFIWSLYAAIKSRWKSSAVLYGLSLASKWSALYGIVPLAMIYINQVFLSSRAQPRDLIPSIIHNSLFILRLSLISVAVYLLTFTPFITAGHTWAQLWELHRQMWYYHTHLVATHAYQSVPAQWVFVIRPVWYWVNYGQNVLSNIYAQGNPLILWLGLVALILQIPRIKQFPYFIILASYSIFTLPWLLSPRIMFFYHYLPSATFLCVLLASYLSTLSKRSMVFLLLLTSISLLLISPMLYGFPMPQLYWDTLFKIFPSWK